jgi:hypothetical protein
MDRAAEETGTHLMEEFEAGEWIGNGRRKHIS